MHKLTQFRLCAASRAIRLAAAELGIEMALAEEYPWSWRPAFLALNPGGDLPVLELAGGPILCGAYAISEYLAEEVRRHPPEGSQPPLFPGDMEARAEARRLVTWFLTKFEREVTAHLIEAKVASRLKAGAPLSSHIEADAVRAAHGNLQYHLSYITYLANSRRWLGGEELSLCDLAAAAQLSILDYLDEMPWGAVPVVKAWYSRVKSRRSFRALLADRVPGIAPPLHYTNLDF